MQAVNTRSCIEGWDYDQDEAALWPSPFESLPEKERPFQEGASDAAILSWGEASDAPKIRAARISYTVAVIIFGIVLPIVATIWLVAAPKDRGFCKRFFVMC